MTSPTTTRTIQRLQMVWSWINWITVEPVEFLYVLMFTLSNVVRDNLFLDKVCLLDFKFSPESCYNLTHGQEVHKNISDAVQSSVTDLEVLDGILVAIPALIFSLFVGAWSDINGRKAVLVLPFLGNILSFIIYIINYHWFDEISSRQLLLGSVAGLTGGYICLNIGLYGYISDVTDSENRTTRLSILNGVFSAGYVIGITLGGKLFKYYQSYYLNFGLSILCGILGILYAVFFVNESIQKEEICESSTQLQHRFFDFRNVIESLNTAFKSRPGFARAHIIVLIINFAIFMFCLNTVHYDYLLVIKRYTWDASDYSDYLSVQRICRFLGLFLLLPFASNILKLSDSLISTLGTLATIIAYLLIALGPSAWSLNMKPEYLLYFSAILQFNSLITVTIRSQCTKEVEKAEIGRIFSVVGLFQALVPLIANPLFGFIYKSTLNTLPGAYLLTIVGMLIFVLVTSLIMTLHTHRRE